MIHHRWIGPVSAFLMALAMLLVGMSCLVPGVFVGVMGSAQPAYVAAMDKNRVLDIQIVADEAAWAEMLENATAEEYIPATVVIDGLKLENVGIRPKGNSSLSMVARDDTTDRYSFNIEFDHYVPGQTWLGLDKLVINNMQGDATYMKEYLSYDLMDAAGVVTPCYSFSNISVNGELWGFYLAIEALEDGFAQRVYGNDHGKLYKPESTGMGGGQGGESGQAPAERSPQEGDSPATQRRQPPAGQQLGGEPPTGLPAQEAGENPLPQGGEPPAGDVLPSDPAAIAPTEESLPGGRPGEGGFGGGGGFGGRGGMAAGGVSLQYVDDQVSSYAAIFESAVFKTSEQNQKALIAALKKLSAGEDLEAAVDVEATLRYFAVNTFLVSLDSYQSGMGHNYYLYEKDGQLTMLPWDYNLAFAGFQSGNASAAVNFPIDTPVSGVSLSERPMLGKLLEVEAYRELYHQYLGELVADYFDSGRFAETVDRLNALIAPYVEADPTAFYDYAAYQKGVEALKVFGALRAQSVKGQLAGTVPSTSEAQTASPDLLVPTSGLNLSDMGSQGGGQGGQGGFGGMAGGNRGNRAEAEQVMGQNAAQRQTDAPARGFGGGPPGMGQSGRAPEPTGPSAADWAVLGGSTALLLGGMAFVWRFRRRRG